MHVWEFVGKELKLLEESLFGVLLVHWSFVVEEERMGVRRVRGERERGKWELGARGISICI